MQRSWIEINRQALLSNTAAFRTVMSPDCALMVVVKADAYGHGLGIVAPVVAENADWLGVDSLEEASALEKIGLKLPVLILGHTALDDLPEVVRHGFRQVVFRTDTARRLSGASEKLGRKARIHIKVETGTHRLGIPLFELEDFLGEIKGLLGLDVEGIYTHFANIEDTLDPSYAQLQTQRFQEALGIAERIGLKPQMVHTAASAGVLLYPETHLNMVRVGIGAYGIWPSRETRIAARERGREIELAPVLTWKTRVAQVKTVEAGHYVGYGLTYQASRKMQIAVIPIGFYDGYDRRLSNSGKALVRGKTVAVVGRVAMNMTMLDVTAAGAALDDEVVLIGRQEDAEIPVEDLAEKTGTIPYETLARIHPSIPRVLV